MVDVPVPLEVKMPAAKGGRFSPGIEYHTADGRTQVAICIAERSRYRGFWTFLGTLYRRGKIDLEARRDGALLMTLTADGRLLDAAGKPIGNAKVTTSMMRVPSLHDRVTVTDTAGRTVGEVEIKQFTDYQLLMTDVARGRAYRVEATFTKTPESAAKRGFIRLMKGTTTTTIRGVAAPAAGAGEAKEIDVRLLLAMRHYLDCVILPEDRD